MKEVSVHSLGQGWELNRAETQSIPPLLGGIKPQKEEGEKIHPSFSVL